MCYNLLISTAMLKYNERRIIMLKYLIYCDFATLKCNFKKFGEFLSHYTDDLQNINNNIWLVEINDTEAPFYNELDNLPKDLENAGYADKDSVVFVAKYSELTYRFAGVDESFHVD